MGYCKILREYFCPTIYSGLDFLGLSVQRGILSMKLLRLESSRSR